MLSLINCHLHHISGHIVLYHACFEQVPASLGRNVHNVTPENMRRQLTWLQSHFDMVSLDDWFMATDRRGKAAITFDDAYKSVFTHAVPILIELGIPATIFIVGCTLQGGIFWRDKIRLLIEDGQINAFLTFLKTTDPDLPSLDADRFYHATKEPHIDSSRVNTALDAFLSEQGIALDNLHYAVETREELTNHPLITYGNHSHRHYVLSSLPDDIQRADLEHNATQLTALDIPQTKIFSVPFGGLRDFNATTVATCKALGYTGLVLSRNRVNFGPKTPDINGFPTAERYMPPDDCAAFQKMLFRDGLIKPLARGILNKP